MQLLVDMFSADLPALLSTASLDNFDEYNNGNVKRSDKKELCVLAATDGDVNEKASTLFIIKCQLYKVINEYIDYYDVIRDYINDNITPELLGYTIRTKLVGDFFPIDDNVNSSFVFFQLEFSHELDDCEEY
jgi:hypothetical protein